MGVGSGGQEGHGPPWIFIHGTNIVDRGLKVLFFGLFFRFHSVVINKCCLLNPKKYLAKSVLSFSRKTQKMHL